jgi:hypothetical protein
MADVLMIPGDDYVDVYLVDDELSPRERMLEAVALAEFERRWRTRSARQLAGGAARRRQGVPRDLVLGVLADLEAAGVPSRRACKAAARVLAEQHGMHLSVDRIRDIRHRRTK